jgi:predicted DNA-binding transcriptional regulator AlpA
MTTADPGTAVGLDDLAAAPARAAGLSADARQVLLVRAAAALAALAAIPLPVAGASASHQADQLLDVEEAAGRLAVSRDWLYRRASRLPFTIRLGPGAVRFSAAGLERWLRRRQGR